MAYTISFTDEANKGTITVEDNTINRQTSLDIPGRYTTAYGATVAENFLHLLENFAATTEPSQPIEGQLWYDSTLGVETLKIYNGTNWVPASGITKSINTPALAQTGDLWVDTDNQQLYLFTGGGWILVGPSFSEGLSTGARADQIVGQDNNLYTILRVEVAGTTVGIVNGNDNSFIPKATIPGFSTINPGFNLINRDTNGDGLSNFKFFGTAEKAENLIVNNEIVSAANFLRGNTTSTTTFPLNVQNNQGINYGVNGELSIGVEGQAGIIQHNVGGSNIDLRVRNDNVTRTVIRVDSNLRVGVNTEAPDEALDVVGNIQSSGSLFVNGTTQSTTINDGALVVRGGAAIKLDLNVGGEAEFNNLLTSRTIVPDVDSQRDIGSAALPYRNMHANSFIGNLQGNVTGTITGRSTESDKLTSRTTFIMEGDVSTDVPVEFDGQFQDPLFDNGNDGSGNPLPAGEQPLQKKFRTSISNEFIANKVEITDILSADELIINQVSGNAPGLKKVTKNNFLKTVPRTPAGVIQPYGGDEAPDGWVLCNGQFLDKEDWKELFDVIGYKFKAESSEDLPSGFFAVPDFRGRMPLGADNMGGVSANVVTAGYADSIGSVEGSENKIIDVTNLPQHEHTLQDEDENQFYAVQNRQDPTTDTAVNTVDGPTATGTAQELSTSGPISSQDAVGQPFNIMPPTVTINYIIYGGRE